jgi:hypothetical protein
LTGVKRDGGKIEGDKEKARLFENSGGGEKRNEIWSEVMKICWFKIGFEGNFI